MTTDAGQRRQSRERYEHVLNTVRANTGRPGEPQFAGIRPRTVLLHCCAHGRFDVDAVNRTIQAALQNNDLIEWTGDDGRPRLARAADVGLRTVIAEQNCTTDPDVTLIERCVALLDQ